MNWITESLTGAVQEVLVTVLLGVLSLGSLYALTYIRRAKARLQTQTDNDTIDRLIERTALLVESTVLALESTVAKQLREAIKNGRADRTELVALGTQAVNDVLEHLGSEGEALLEALVGDARDYVRDLVEAQVERLKQGTVATLLPTTLEQIAPNSQSSATS